MSWKNLKQASLADALLVEHAALTELDGVHNLIDWQAMAAELADIHVKKRDEQAYPPIIMFRALLLQAWYNLSDPALEKQLARDLLFRRFVGLSLDQPIPDHSSLWRFRNLLSEQGRFERLLNQLNAQLAEAGLRIRSGQISIMDVSVLTASRNRPDKTADGRSTLDPEAAYNVKAGSDGQRRTTSTSMLKRMAIQQNLLHRRQCPRLTMPGYPADRRGARGPCRPRLCQPGP
ncbi:MAG: transposase [Pseudomonadota bacterium]|nr:transposase [Pseudomonadota bacterium]